MRDTITNTPPQDAPAEAKPVDDRADAEGEAMLKAIEAAKVLIKTRYKIDDDFAARFIASTIVNTYLQALPDKPSPVSLDDAKRAYESGRLTSGAQNMNMLDARQKEAVRHEAGIAAVLTAAHVPYTEGE